MPGTPIAKDKQYPKQVFNESSLTQCGLTPSV